MAFAAGLEHEIEEHMPSGASEVCHFHRNTQQFFLILSSQAIMKTDGEQTLWLARQASLRRVRATNFEITPENRSAS